MKVRPLEFDWLQTAVAGKASAFRVLTRLVPAGGEGDKVFPPTYKHPERNASLYAIEDRLIGGRQVRTVLLDSAASQANRMEEALLKAFDAKKCDIPVFTVTIPRSGGTQTRVTVLDAPHRLTDAIFRDCDLNKTRFRESPEGRRLFQARMENANAVLELCPTGLIFGYWDSQSAQGVLGAKVARALVSEIVGFNAVSGRRTSSRIDPLLISSDAAKIYKHESDMWTLDENQAIKEKGKPKLYGKETKAGKPSAINHGNVAPTVSKEDDPGGITISEGLQTTVLSLPQLRRFKFPDAKTNKASLDRDVAARSVLTALALYAIALQNEEGYFLRSRCQLIPLEPSRSELIGATAKDVEPFSLTVDSAQTTFQHSVEAAKKQVLHGEVGKSSLLQPRNWLNLSGEAMKRFRRRGWTMLAIEVGFLMGRYVATDFRDRDVAEWPPHPSRLFSALVAAAFESGLGESSRAALLWLESLPPPCLHAHLEAPAQTPVTVFVPINDPEGPPLPQRPERQPRGFPSSVLDVAEVGDIPTVSFIWPEANPDEVLETLLVSVAQSVSYLGSSRSPVCVRVTDQAPTPNWIPDGSGEVVLRTPSKGRLESLEWHFNNGLRPNAGTFHQYRFGVGHDASEAVPQAVLGEMVTYRLGGPIAMEIETTLKLTHVLRASAMRLAQDELGKVPGVLSGHDEEGRPLIDPHAAYVALPFLSDTQVHADGRILGVAVVLPRRISAADRHQVMRVLRKIDHLLIRSVGQIELERLTPDKTVHHNLRLATWAGPTKRWASITPVLLDRFPKKKETAQDIIGRSCENTGLPRPKEITLDRYSPLHGVSPSFRFLTDRRGPAQQKTHLHTHVILTFDEPVQGPLLLGAGRHFGLGLFRPLQELAQ